MKLVELFCGCGGFSLGAHKAGFEVAAAYDVDPILTSSYSVNFPDVKLVLQDIATLNSSQVVEAAGGVPFGIFGGPPCQGFSSIGRRDKNDPRRELLGHFFRIVKELEPTFFVMENVVGLAYADARPVLDEALKSIARLYDVLGPHILDAGDFGAATTRKRMFVVGVRKDRKSPLRLSDIQAYMRKPATVMQAIADLAGAKEMAGSNEQLGFDRWLIQRNGKPSNYAARLRSADKIFTGYRSTAHTPDVVKRFATVKQGEYDTIGRHPRLSWKGQCPTLRAGTGSDKGSYQSVRPLHPTDNRVITVREAARLQGFPDSHIFHPTVWHSFRMIGNSVSPIIAEAIFRSIASRLNLPIANTLEAFAEAAE